MKAARSQQLTQLAWFRPFRQLELLEHGSDGGRGHGIELPVHQHGDGQGRGDRHQQRMDQPDQRGEAEVVLRRPALKFEEARLMARLIASASRACRPASSGGIGAAPSMVMK